MDRHGRTQTACDLCPCQSVSVRGSCRLPDHHDRGRHAAADVAREKSFCPRDLPLTRTLGEMFKHLDDLTNSGGSDRMTVADQAATGVDRQISDFKSRISDLDQVANRWERGRTAFE